jgi:hypothetical protein
MKKMQSDFSEPAVLEWDRAIHKGVRTQDGNPLGYIAADDEEFIFVLSSRSREYRIPKSKVVQFDGSTIIIDLETAELEQFKIR